MRITLAFVMSLDGKITRGEDPNIRAWSSQEDWDHFVALRAKSDAIVMDRTTYESVRPAPEPGKLRLVLTHHPGLYSDVAVPGQLEFVNATPKQLVQRLKRDGHQKVLLAGGGTISSDFLAAGVVDELYITIEPLLFGRGSLLLADAPLEVVLQLQSVQTLNKRGSLLAHYLIEKKR